MKRQRVLVVEDDGPLRGVLAVALRSHGFDTEEADCGASALGQINARQPDALILDLGLPDMDGFQVTRAVRAQHQFPIIILSARGEEGQQIAALDAGANDYVVKPFREGELMARVRAALRYAIPVSERAEITVGDLLLNAIERSAFLAGRHVPLTPTEFKLLHILAREAGRVVTHRRLLLDVWGPHQVEDIQYLRVYMKQLRNKIESDSGRPKRIVTVLGVGYRLVP